MYENAAVLAVCVLVDSAVAGRVERSWLSGPIVFTVAGFILGPAVLGLLHLSVTATAVRLLAEATLAMVLFCDAAKTDLSVLRRSLLLPKRLLLFGLPLTIVLGALVAALIFPTLGALEWGAYGDDAGPDRCGARQAGGYQPCGACGSGRHSTSRAGLTTGFVCPSS